MDISTDFESGHMLYIFDEVAVLDHILRFADNLFTSSNIYMYWYACQNLLKELLVLQIFKRNKEWFCPFSPFYVGIIFNDSWIMVVSQTTTLVFFLSFSLSSFLLLPPHLSLRVLSFFFDFVSLVQEISSTYQGTNRTRTRHRPSISISSLPLYVNHVWRYKLEMDCVIFLIRLENQLIRHWRCGKLRTTIIDKFDAFSSVAPVN